MTIPGIHILVPRHSRRAVEPKVLTPRRGILRYLKEQPLGAAAAIIIVVFVTLAALAPWLAPYNPLAQNRDQIMVPPNGSHLMGTDELGRDVLSRVMYGARTSLLISVATLTIGGLIGLLLGVVSGYFGGTWVDTIIQRVMDSLMAVPSIVLLLFVAALLGPSIRNTILALALLVVPAFNRVSRGEMLRIREETYVEAARAVGCSTPRILFRYGLPNLMAPLFVVTSLLFAIVLIAESALSFLGIGTPPPTPSWGRMLSEASRQLEIAPWMALFPGLALSLSVLAFNLLGDALRDFLDPKQRR
ncbi:ABC transporter permease [Aeromicrobium senzhongii]|uniref:ABC transporter permease n=1 Tax=Aeromicrobium senzhongii TaxID=2663859 RepID=A0ABX6SSE8_9ACTN|nr:ABC transporter permease [Aeromicrobium senzhongii]MTB89548.1 ABC transporter permease subunit [Aeromicrobium senzhongii]QNL94324.1 ABC transporter permease [Aeromicrobium senzhongii]